MKNLNEIKELISQGKSSSALIELKKWQKKNKSSAIEKITISEIYTWLGDDVSSWKVLGSPLSIREMEVASEDQMILQLRQAYLLGMFGAKFISYRLYHFATEKFSPQKLQQLYPQYYQNRGYLCISQYYPNEAVSYFAEARKLYPQDDYRFFFITLGLVDAHAMLGEFQTSLEYVENLISLNCFNQGDLFAILQQVKGEILNYLGKSKESFEIMTQSKKQFSKENQSKDYAYLLKHLGLHQCWNGKIDIGIKYLQLAKELLLHETGTPTSLLEVLFWIELHYPESLTLKEKVMLRCYPSFSIYSQRLGRKYNQDSCRICPWVPTVKSNVDYWLVEKNQILELNDYSTTSKKEPLIDFVSNSYCSEKEKIIFTPLEGRVLLALFGASERGVHLYHLTDKIYQHEFTTWEAGIDRVKKLLKSLSQKIENIEINLNTVKWNWDSKWRFILPSDLEIGSPVKSLFIKFGRMPLPREIEEEFSVNKRTAQRWIKEYSEL